LKTKLLAVTALFTILLNGCGWHLRGSEPLPKQLQSLQLQTASENSVFARSLRRSLESMNVALSESASNATYRLNVSGISQTRRTLSTTGTARVAEYSLTSALTYSVYNQEGEQLITPTRLSAEKIYLYNPANAVSSYEEESLLREEMQRELVQQLIRRYRAIKPSAVITSTPAEAE